MNGSDRESCNYVVRDPAIVPKLSDQVIQSDAEERVLEAGAIAQIAANSELPIALGQKGTSIGLSEYVGQEPRQPRYGSGIISALNEPPADARLAPNFGLCAQRDPALAGWQL